VQVFAPNLLRPSQEKETATSMLYDMPIAINVVASFILFTDDIFTQPPVTPAPPAPAPAHSTPSALPASSSSSTSSFPPQPQTASITPPLSSTLPGPVTIAGKRVFTSQTL
jgi:hypothetical protein